LKFCRWLTTTAGGDPDKKKYSDRQLAVARTLLRNRDHREMRDMVTWATTDRFWADKVTQATDVSRHYDKLKAAWRAASAANGNGGGGKEAARARRTAERMSRARGTRS
jgi:hypothetical protein